MVAIFIRGLSKVLSTLDETQRRLLLERIFNMLVGSGDYHRYILKTDTLTLSNVNLQNARNLKRSFLRTAPELIIKLVIVKTAKR